MGWEALERRPGYDRTIVTKAKILQYLSDGQVKGQRQIQKETHASPTTVNGYLAEWRREGKVEVVMVGKRPRYKITQLGRDELESLTREAERRKRLTNPISYVPVIPSTSFEEQKPIFHVGIGATPGTPMPLSLKTQQGIKQRIEKWVPLVEELQRFTKAEFLEVRVVMGSPPYRLSPRKEKKA